jgi:aminoglycoside/choline kinase family phosphotransferase
MELFPQWFIGELLQYPLNADEQQLLAQTFSYLEQAAAKQPQVVVHRDFHSRNLILRQTQQDRLLPPGLIDFQDALIGPAAYDLVSLLKDCYVDWPKSQVRSWALAYYQQAQQQGIWPRLREGEFIQSFDLIGLQRHLKVLGIFARLSLRDDKHGFLNDLPRVLAYTLDVLRQYPALAGLHQWFYQRLMPRIEQQAWYYPLKLNQ